MFKYFYPDEYVDSSYELDYQAFYNAGYRADGRCCCSRHPSDQRPCYRYYSDMWAHHAFFDRFWFLMLFISGDMVDVLGLRPIRAERHLVLSTTARD